MSHSRWTSNYGVNNTRAILVPISLGMSLTGVPCIFLFFDLQLILILVIMLSFLLWFLFSTGGLFINKLFQPSTSDGVFNGVFQLIASLS